MKIQNLFTILLMVFAVFAADAMNLVPQESDSIFAVENIIQVVGPFVVYFITKLLNTGILGKIPKWLIPIAIVPALATAAAWVQDFNLEDASWWVNFGINLLAIVIHEVTKAVGNIGSSSS